MTAVTELPAVNVTDQLPATARPPVANATVAAVTEATTNRMMNDNFPDDAQNRRPPHSGTVIDVSLFLYLGVRSLFYSILIIHLLSIMSHV